MTREAIIQSTVTLIKKLPKGRAREVYDFADYLYSKWEEERLNEGILSMVAESSSFDFLNEDEELYKESDLKVRFGEKRYFN